MKVKLIAYTKDPEKVVTAAIRQCYSAIGAGDLKKKTDKETQKRLIGQIMASGHTSTLEHASFTFAVEGISRVTEVQLMRHRLASYSVQSGRYVKRGKAKYVVPEAVKADKAVNKKFNKLLKEIQEFYNQMMEAGIKAEDARYVQPQSIQTKVVITMNARALLHFFELRCSRRAQWEIQRMANLMLAQAKKVAPVIFEKAGPTCLNSGICYEGDLSCGLYKALKGEVRARG